MAGSKDRQGRQEPLEVIVARMAVRDALERDSTEMCFVLERAARNLMKGGGYPFSVDDLYHETIIRTLEKAHQLQEVENLTKWMAEIQRNTFLEWVRRANMEKRHETMVQEAVMERLETHTVVRDPLTHIVERETVESLTRWASSMAPALKEFFESAMKHEWDRDAVAKELGWDKPDYFYRYTQRVRDFYQDHPENGVLGASMKAMWGLVVVALAFRHLRESSEKTPQA